MTTAGIIGGIGPESTQEYYRLIIASYRRRKGDGSYPRVIVNSIDLKTVVDLMRANRLVELADHLLGELRRLERAGADFGALAANTPHIVFDTLRRESPIPLISIVEVTRQAAEALGLKRIGLFGTRYTMQGRFYPEVFAPAGITLVTPEAGEQDYIHEKYMTELVNGVFLPDTRQGLMDIVERMRTREGIEGVILGGTELPLILRDVEDGEVPFLDTTRLHVEQIVARLLS
ncbi:MAG: aspartate racemase [Acidobacteria bacterium]|nr:MAG: aspartate racemase [Acidobacteriota bacterium]